MGSVKTYSAQIMKNDIVSNVEVGSVVYLKVKDLSTSNQYGTKIIVEPLELLTDPMVIEELILADRKRVADIYVKAAQENLDKGWYTGDAIMKGIVFTASHPTTHAINLDLRQKRLKNAVNACLEYSYRDSPKYIELCKLAIDNFDILTSLNGGDSYC